MCGPRPLENWGAAAPLFLSFDVSKKRNRASEKPFEKVESTRLLELTLNGREAGQDHVCSSGDH